MIHYLGSVGATGGTALAIIKSHFRRWLVSARVLIIYGDASGNPAVLTKREQRPEYYATAAGTKMIMLDSGNIGIAT